VPYRVDIAHASDAVLDRLLELGALDVDRSPDGGIAALMPDGVATERLARALGVDHLSISPAVGRDADSVWILTPRAIRIGHLQIVPADASAAPGALRLTDSAAFGTGRHPTTAMCLEAIEEALQHSTPGALLDVGTGSGVLALAALLMGVPQALGRRVGHHGRLVLSGIPSSSEIDVDRAYRRLGMRHVRAQSRAGWSALVLLASW
jgi:ribosomal protein L11 methylase PrmA